MVSAGRHALRPKPRSPDWFAPPAVTSEADCLKTTAAAELRQLAELHESARRLGQICFPLQNYRKQLAQSIARRMSQRLDDFIYQSAAFSLDNFPRQAAEEILPEYMLVQPTTPSVKTWRATTHSEVMAMVSPLIEMSDYFCAGGARALRTPSERVVRVVAMIVPNVEISWVASQGMERLYVNFQYVLADEDGEVHPPKDPNRREMELEEVTELRQNLLSAVIAMHAKGFSLAPGFLRQMGCAEEASQVEAMLNNPYNPPRVRSGSSSSAAPAKMLQGSSCFEIDRIVDEKSSAGRAQQYYLVRWAGYDPSWEVWRTSGEVGDPVESWEPLSVVRRTEALAAWTEQRSHDGGLLGVNGA